MKLLWDTLERHAAAADASTSWPADSWQAIVGADVLRWSVPHRFGGRERAPAELLPDYTELASHCLTMAFILSQREAALRYLLRGVNEELQRQWIPDLATASRHVTLGVSHLTTSRQYGEPAMRAEVVKAGYVLDGEMPWVTAADRADGILTGATLPDGKQFLAMLAPNAAGVEVGPPLELLALRGSRTTTVRCRGAFVPLADMVTQPTENVMTTMKGGTGGLETSALAIGLATACARWLRDERINNGRNELQTLCDRAQEDLANAQTLMLQMAGEIPAAQAIAELRAVANALVLRTADSVMAAAKGAGFVAGHPAERWVRQARFFLVWSCPGPALARTMEAFWNGDCR